MVSYDFCLETAYRSLLVSASVFDANGSMLMESCWQSHQSSSEIPSPHTPLWSDAWLRYVISYRMPVLQQQPENVYCIFLLQESSLNLFLFCESRNNNLAFLHATALVAKELNLLFLTFLLDLRSLCEPLSFNQCFITTSALESSFRIQYLHLLLCVIVGKF
jgi:hypothetical protein